MHEDYKTIAFAARFTILGSVMFYGVIIGIKKSKIWASIGKFSKLSGSCTFNFFFFGSCFFPINGIIAMIVFEIMSLTK